MASNPQVPSEYQEQVAVAEWLDKAVGPRAWIHPPNEGIRDPRIGAKLKRAGLKPGAPDIIIFARPPCAHGQHGAAIELKRRGDGGRNLPAEQIKWLENLSALGWCTAVCYGAQDAIAQLDRWGYRKP